MSIAEELLADFEKEARNTRRVLAAVPDGRWDWKPHARSMTLGRLAGHVAEAPMWAEAMVQGALDFAVMGASWRPFSASGQAELLDTFERSCACFRSSLAGRSDATLLEIWTMRHGPRVLVSMPRREAIRANALHHVIHHRGQLTVYLRLLGVPVPATYGPTADAPAP